MAQRGFAANTNGANRRFGCLPLARVGHALSLKWCSTGGRGFVAQAFLPVWFGGSKLVNHTVRNAEKKAGTGQEAYPTLRYLYTGPLGAGMS